MVLLKKCFALLAAAATAFALPYAEPVEDLSGTEVNTLEERQITRNGPVSLQYSPEGRFLFLAGLRLTGTFADIFSEGGGEGMLGKVMFQNFYDWYQANAFNLPMDIHVDAFELLSAAKQGGVIRATPVSGNGYDAGFVIFTNRIPDAQHVNALVQCITRWVQQSGAVLKVFTRANGFIDPSRIGAAPAVRSRSAKCPAKKPNLLKYAKRNLSAVDPNKDLRFAGKCSK